MSLITIIVVICILGNCCVDNLDNSKWFRHVKTNYGVVRGWKAADGDYFAYLGVPYAAPPVGRNRFKAPLPPLEWSGVYDARRTVRCPQNGEGDEDCLILNIFTPITAINGPLPVLVYIHGGSFLIGTGQTSGLEPLVRQNIIVITLNYRLGALGFLCLGIEEAPGNAGLKDQVAALQWIQENIANFGGDPRQVTLYGMSAGAASVELLVMSKATNGLFEKAIVESASATPVWAVDHNPISTAENLAIALNFSMRSKSLFELFQNYQNEPSNSISKVNFEYYSNLTDGTFGFVPCVERELNNTKSFLNEPPLDILVKESFDKVPIMFMFTTLEGLYLRSEEYYLQNYKERMQANFLDFMPADLIFDTIEIKKGISENIKHFYFGNKTLGDDTQFEYLNYFGDHLILQSLLNAVEVHAKNGNPVYLMEFGYKGNIGSYEKFYEDIKVAGHGDVVKYAILNKEPEDISDKLTVKRVSRLIANFVKFGNPTPNRTSLLPILWPVVQPGNMSYLYMNNNFVVYEEPYWDRKVFWDQLYAKFRRHIKAVDPGLL